ncbi:alpha/beta hydrolase [Lactococcus garvieae]|uniref:alpha/beta hydrolase n=1 Tax=Lactococcus garvieae TaxID=1363 RepID=UPI00254D6B62|nr:alpha/beta hydrolase [Lactococcus garvieae]
MKKYLKIFLFSLIIGICGIFILLNYTPKPLFSFINILPSKAKLTKPNNYKYISEQTKVERNICYSNKYSNSSLDIYYPKKNSSRKKPVILFIHGGGFFKGDKEMARYFGPTLSDSRYAFISLNYNLAPNATIFDQVKQINEAVNYLNDNAEKYSLDVKKMNLSGSSAGGFLALQLLSTYHNENYAKQLGIVPQGKIKFNSLLLYSTVYDLTKFQTYKGGLLIDYPLSKIGWGITGEKNWRSNDELKELMNLNNYINEKFPPVFITDGNTKTFTKQAYSYYENLKKNNVPTQTLFFNNNDKVGHGYQLNMSTPSSKKAVEKSLLFLRKWNE